MRYRIEVRGELDSRFGASLDCAVERRRGSTVLTGEVADRTKLHRLLERIEGLGVEIVGVRADDGPGSVA